MHLKSLTIAFMLSLLPCVVASQVDMGTIWEGGNWSVKVVSYGSSGYSCEAQTFQNGHLLTIAIGQNGAKTMSFISSGSLGSEIRNTVMLSVDRKVYNFSVRGKNLSPVEYIARGELDNDEMSRKLLIDLTFGHYLKILDSHNQVTAKWILDGSSEALQEAKACQEILAK